MSNTPFRHEYLVISRGQWDESASPQEIQGAIDRFYDWHAAQVAQGRMKPGSRLAMEGRVVSRSAVLDGPFAETKELVGGFWFILADSLDEAAALAAQNPCLAFGLTLELRELDPGRASTAVVASETPEAWRHAGAG